MTSSTRPLVSVVCVFNDPDVMAECLTASIAAFPDTGAVEFIPVDNVRHDFTTAGAALNHGASVARADHVLFAHQDVYLHSLEPLVAATKQLTHDAPWGILGANGVDDGGTSIGTLRDRVLLIGESAPTPRPVVSLDEVAFMIRRDVVAEHPLTEDPDLAWHAYGVEYALRMRALGRDVGAVNLGVTHNSLSINLARLDVGHRRIAALYPSAVPVPTTCGIVGARGTSWKQWPVVRDHRWRARWLRRSIEARRLRRSAMRFPIVFAEIRDDVDALTIPSGEPLHVINIDRDGAFAPFAQDPLRLSRHDQTVDMLAVADLDAALAEVDRLPTNAAVLLGEIGDADLAVLQERLDAGRPWVVGMQTGHWWLVGGSAAAHPPSAWAEPKAVPLGAARSRS